MSSTGTRGSRDPPAKSPQKSESSSYRLAPVIFTILKNKVSSGLVPVQMSAEGADQFEQPVQSDHPGPENWREYSECDDSDPHSRTQDRQREGDQKTDDRE